MAGHCHEQAKIRDRAREEKEAEERIEDAIWAPAAVQWRRDCMAYAEARNIENANEDDVDLGPTVADAEAELLAHFGTLDIVLDSAKSRMQATVSETAMEKKKRYNDEKKVRKQNKKLGHSDMLVACSQNFNGSSSREKIEEAVRIMSDTKIGIIFGQEGRRLAYSA